MGKVPLEKPPKTSSASSSFFCFAFMSIGRGGYGGNGRYPGNGGTKHIPPTEAEAVTASQAWAKVARGD